MSLRVRRSSRNLIDRAAKAVGKNRTEFIIEAARREAEAVLLDQRLFDVDGKAFEDFKAALDRPARKNVRLRKLLSTPAPWDR
jgi:uncharacterized protein (DUF1778 family)